MLLWWWHRPCAAQTEKRTRHQAHALTEGPASPTPEHETRSRAQVWARSFVSFWGKKLLVFCQNDSPLVRGRLQNAKSQRTRSEQVSFRNCRLYRISPYSWREFFLAQSKAVYAENFRERHKRPIGPAHLGRCFPGTITQHVVRLSYE